MGHKTVLIDKSSDLLRFIRHTRVESFWSTLYALVSVADRGCGVGDEAIRAMTTMRYCVVAITPRRTDWRPAALY